MTFPWPLLALSSSCFQLASPVFLLSNYIGIDTNQREWKKKVEAGETKCSMSFALISMLYTCSFIELLALTLSIPVDTMVGNHSAGTLNFWSCSALLFSGFFGLGYLLDHWTISAPTLVFDLLCFSWPASLLFPLKSLPPIFLHCVIKLWFLFLI